MELFRRLQTLARDSSFSLERRLINVYLGWRQDSIFACCKNARLTVISFFAVSFIGKKYLLSGVPRKKNADQLLSIFLLLWNPR